MTLAAFFFDVLHLDGDDLLDRPLASVRDRSPTLVGASARPVDRDRRPRGRRRVPRRRARDRARRRDGEGARLAATRPAGAARAWRKVKPVRTLDLVVLAAEWGHGRRRGWLSNLHLGARDPETGEFVMVGKTFKGLTDELLTWQTEQLPGDRGVATDGSRRATCGRSSSSRSRSTACRRRRATPAASRCASRASARYRARQVARRRRHDRHRARAARTD